MFQVQMGNLNFSLGKVQYDNLSFSTFPLEAQIGVGVGASIVALIVLIIVLIYRLVHGLFFCCVEKAKTRIRFDGAVERCSNHLRIKRVCPRILTFVVTTQGLLGQIIYFTTVTDLQ